MMLFLRCAFFVLCVIGAASSLPAVSAHAAPSPGTSDQQAKVRAILAQFPDGGQELADAIAQAVETDPSLASVVVTAALTANPAQQTAIGTGLANAAVFFANSNSPNAKAAQEQLQAALASAPTSTVTAFNIGGGATALLSLLGTSTSTQLTTSNCISPSQPGNRC